MRSIAKRGLLFSVMLMASMQLAIARQVDPVAETMLAYQRASGGWPKAVNEKKIDYTIALSNTERARIMADSLEIDATFDNKATSREINYLVKAFKKTGNKAYLASAEKGIRAILKTQYDNGGWPQYLQDKRFYRSQITFNDDAMINVVSVLHDIVERKNDFEVVDQSLREPAAKAVAKAVSCILKLQIRVNGKRTAWCAQYDALSLQPAKARAYELPSLSGSESVGIVRFLMRQNNPGPEVKEAIKSAMAWFNEVQIKGARFEHLAVTADPHSRKASLVPDPNSTVWARFYEIGTNRPFFSGRDGQKKYALAEIEAERGDGYAWYGQWPAKLFARDFPAWQKKYDN